MRNATEKYLLSLALFGSNGIVASLIDLPSIFIVLARVSLGAALLAGIVLASRKARANLKAPEHPRQALYLAISGAALGVAWLFLFEAYRYVGVGVASLLFYCGPVIVMALSPMLFHTRLTPQKVAGFAAVLCGAFLVVGNGLGEGIRPMGIFLGAMSAVAYAVMVIFSKKVSNIDGVECSAIQLCGSFAAVAAYMAVSARASERARRALHRPREHGPRLLPVLLVHGRAARDARGGVRLPRAALGRGALGGSSRRAHDRGQHPGHRANPGRRRLLRDG